MIIAGVGTGKTHTLMSKYTHLIKTLNVKDFNILAVTFTNKAAREMRERAEEICKNKL